MQGRAVRRAGWWLAAGFALLQALLAGACWLGLHLYFESRDRATLQAHFESARSLLLAVDNAAALAAAAPRLYALLGDEHQLAVRLQGAHGQALYEQNAQHLPDTLSTHASAAPPLPMVRWQAQGSTWRATAIQITTRLPGAAPLTLAVGLNISAQDRLLRHLALALGLCVLLSSVLFATFAQLLLGRALGKMPA